MQTTRTTLTPHLCRRVSRAPPTLTRARALHTFFPFSPVPEAFSPFFRLLDAPPLSYSSRHRAHNNNNNSYNYYYHHAPRFDVREINNAVYEVQGELPGLTQADVSIEFVDANTLVIRGRQEQEREQEQAVEAPAEGEGKGKEPAASPASTATATAAGDEEVQSGYRQATVEDDYVDAGAESTVEGEGKGKSAHTAAAEPEPATTTITTTTTTPTPTPYKYWISERTTGEFERRFRFPGPVDQEAVKASLRNGILSVVVPKVARKERRVMVE